ncbi:SapC family protein [Aquabacter cavernae]|uniref:SapC family protein n=1 Tax=Aquabacter cavernae TaxID=2496029 RepID=UPI000F8D3E93|nr:SapC family protein [Aquabacter cavernae]
MTSTSQGASPARLPLFYRSPALLRLDEHHSVGVRENSDSAFAAAATAIPLVAGEFLQAQRHYPIVFSSDAGAMPLAVTGLAAGQNLFVTADGAWAAGAYVPGYVRRYPFISMVPAEGGNTMLGIDLAAPQVSMDAARDGARPLFTAEGTASEAAAAAIAFCDTYALEHERTREFAAALEANGLLIERAARIALPDGTEKTVQGFRLIDDAAFRALSGETLASFHARGWLDLVVLHIASQASWHALMARAATQS